MKKLNDFLTFLEGKKTYIISTILGLLNVAVALGYIDPAHLEQLNLILVALGLGALRAAKK